MQFEPLLQSWIDTHPYTVRIEENPKTGQNTICVEVTDTIPNNIALVIGDAIHNLRTALDHAAYEIAFTCGASRTVQKRTYFPFEGDRKDLQASPKYRAIESASKKAADIILNTIKPYKAGNHTLWAINKIDVMDKHRLLIPYAQAISIAINAVDNKNNVFTGNIFTQVGAGKFRAFSTAGKLQITHQSEPGFNIFFGPETPLNGQPIPETLRLMAIEAYKAIAALK